MLSENGNKKCPYRFSTYVTKPLPRTWNPRNLHEWENHALKKTNKAHGRTAHGVPELKNESILRVKPLKIFAQVIDEGKPA